MHADKGSIASPGMLLKVRAWRRRIVDNAVETRAPRERKRRYSSTMKDTLMDLVGGVGSCVRHAVRGDDPDASAGCVYRKLCPGC